MERNGHITYDGTNTTYSVAQELSKSILDSFKQQSTLIAFLMQILPKFNSSMFSKAESWILVSQRMADSCMITDTETVEPYRWAIKSGKETRSLVRLEMVRTRHETTVTAYLI